MRADPGPSNRLLAALPADDWAQMRQDFHEVSLPAGKVLFEAEEPLEQLYFPTVGVISAVAVFANGVSAEMATIGREGMTNIAAILGGDRSICRELVQVPGAALTIGHDDFRRLEHDIRSFRVILLGYARAYLAQVLQSVACNGVHPVGARAARWLLMAHDRSEEDEFPLTQEFLAEMLGVSRPAVSMVARTLQRAGLIRYRRGVVGISDRAGLESISCECYNIIRRQYERRLARVMELNGR
jgi:CRP-like cAMP-binding protein